MCLYENPTPEDTFTSTDHFNIISNSYNGLGVAQCETDVEKQQERIVL